MRYTVKYKDRNTNEEIHEATPFDTLDEAIARAQRIVLDGKAVLGSVHLNIVED